MSEVVWVLDVVGYDTRGGMAEVFRTREAAKAAAGVERWVVSETFGRVEESEDRNDLGDLACVYPAMLDVRDPRPEDWPEDLQREAAEIREGQERERQERLAARATASAWVWTTSPS